MSEDETIIFSNKIKFDLYPKIGKKLESTSATDQSLLVMSPAIFERQSVDINSNKTTVNKFNFTSIGKIKEGNKLKKDKKIKINKTENREVKMNNVAKIENVDNNKLHTNENCDTISVKIHNSEIKGGIRYMYKVSSNGIGKLLNKPENTGINNKISVSSENIETNKKINMINKSVFIDKKKTNFIEKDIPTRKDNCNSLSKSKRKQEKIHARNNSVLGNMKISKTVVSQSKNVPQKLKEFDLSKIIYGNDNLVNNKMTNSKKSYTSKSDALNDKVIKDINKQKSKVYTNKKHLSKPFERINESINKQSYKYKKICLQNIATIENGKPEYIQKYGTCKSNNSLLEECNKIVHKKTSNSCKSTQNSGINNTVTQNTCLDESDSKNFEIQNNDVNMELLKEKNSLRDDYSENYSIPNDNDVITKESTKCIEDFYVKKECSSLLQDYSFRNKSDIENYLSEFIEKILAVYNYKYNSEDIYSVFMSFCCKFNIFGINYSYLNDPPLHIWDANIRYTLLSIFEKDITNLEDPIELDKSAKKYLDDIYRHLY